jgi:hypothetical protein
MQENEAETPRPPRSIFSKIKNYLCGNKNFKKVKKEMIKKPSLDQ